MTRINAGIPPKKLTDQHLLAEHREIKRICDLYEQRMKKGSIGKIPEKFTLGTGHVSFFLDKGKFTLIRYILLHNECKKRKFNVSKFGKNWDLYQPHHFKDWESTEEANNLIKERITTRINESFQRPRYYGKIISKEQAINLLCK